MEPAVELRQLRYFLAVAEELHFGRAAARLHMSQSPLSRAIRELERDIGVVLFLRTTRRVELTPAGTALVEHARRAIVEIDGGIAATRRAARDGASVLTIGHGPLSRTLAERLRSELARQRPELALELSEDVTPELLRRVAEGGLAAAVVIAAPAPPRGVRVDALRDEPLLAALPAAHPRARAEAIGVGEFVAERVLLPREPMGRHFNAWLRAALLVTGHELGRTLETLSAPWDHRMLPVAGGEAVAPIVGDWAADRIPGVAAVPFDPPITVPFDLAWTASTGAEVVAPALRLRDSEGWLTVRD